MKHYRTIDHTADIAFEITAGSLEELFETAAEVWLKSTAEIKSFSITTKKEIALESFSLENLLVSFISELNYLFLTKKWIALECEYLKINKHDNKYMLRAVLNGSDLQSVKVIPKEEIKAVTFHQMNIEKTGTGYRTKIIFDI